MVQKRTHGDEELCNGSAKQPRQFAPNSELVQCLKFDHYRPDLKLPITAGDSTLAEFQTSTKDIEVNFHVPFVPAYFDHDHSIATPVIHEEVYSSHLDHPPRKPIPIGNDHQAIIPTWVSQVWKVSNLGNCDDEKLMRKCIIPMPDSKHLMENVCNIGNGRTDCICDDMGSVRCVGQHILEAREKLKTTLGEEKFHELGFGDMGEVVAHKWSVEEEQAFHEVVFSNPASSGNNFWDTFSTVFLNKAKKDIVSYYFNVFMLRRRAEQNRRNPMNIDSDDDELHESDDYNKSEIKEVDDVHGYSDDGANQNCYISGSANSCKTFNAHELKAENGDCWPSTFNGYVSEPLWDTGYDIIRSRDKFDFLPTYTVIEEVFGDGNWNLKARDGNGLW